MTTLYYRDRIAFRVTEQVFEQLSAAARQGPLFVRVYAGTKDELKRPRGADVFGCVNFYYLARPRIQLYRDHGNPMIGAVDSGVDDTVRRTWFDEPRDMIVTAVVDQGRMPETSTRVFESLVPSYFDSGIQMQVGATSRSGELVDIGWKPAPRNNSSTNGGVPAPPPPQERNYLGDLMAWQKVSHMIIRDLETRRLDRIDLTGSQVETRAPDINVNDRVFVTVTVTQGKPARVTMWRSYYPECIRAWPKTSTQPPQFEVAATGYVERCEAVFESTLNHESTK